MSKPITSLRVGDLVGVEGHTCWKVTKIYPDGTYNLSAKSAGGKHYTTLRKQPLWLLKMLYKHLSD